MNFFVYFLLFFFLMSISVILENFFDWLFTYIYLVYWYIWYSFDYYVVLTNFTCLFVYFNIEHNSKHSCLSFHSVSILTDILKLWPLSRLLNLTKISNLSVYFDPPFIRYLRVKNQDMELEHSVVLFWIIFIQVNCVFESWFYLNFDNLIILQLEHTVLFQLLQMLLLDSQRH